ncbi:MAG: nuclear transport factor 2 family protein [Nitrososphaerota archaeon]|nr:nuclear transport factor 2 family protein [Nitrososphaerota archaeon]
MEQRPPAGLGAVSDPLARSAAEAVNSRDRERWFGLFADGATFSDDGVEQDLWRWCDEELFGRHTAYIVSVDKVEDGGRTFYARYHSDKWGDFKTFWRFAVRDGKVSRLEVGATSY